MSFKEISRNSLKYNQVSLFYIPDLKEIFNGYEIESVDEESEHVKIYLNKDKDFYLYTSMYSNYDKTVQLNVMCGENSYSFTNSTNNSSYATSYKMIRADDTVILSSFTTVQNTQSPPTSDEHLKICITKAVNVVDNVEHIIVLQANTNGTINKYSDMHTVRESSQNMVLGTSAAMTKAVPVFSYQYPLRCTSVYQKLQSQAQYGKMLLNGESFISGSCFAVKYEEDE